MKLVVFTVFWCSFLGIGLSFLQQAWHLPFAQAFTFYLIGFLHGAAITISARAAA